MYRFRAEHVTLEFHFPRRRAFGENYTARAYIAAVEASVFFLRIEYLES